MRIEFDSDDTLIIMPENSVEAMALKYWAKEYAAHGDKVLEVSTDVIHRLPGTAD
jgi:hypothetical protein